MGEARLQRVRRISRGMESLAAVNHGHRARRNVYDYEHILRDRSGSRVDAEQQMVCVADQRSISRRPGLDMCPRSLGGQVGAQPWRIRHARRLFGADFIAASWSRARRIKNLSPAAARLASNVDLLLLQHFHQTFRWRAQRI